MLAAPGAFAGAARRLGWLCVLCAIAAEGGSMPISTGSMPISTGSMPEAVTEVMQVAQARVEKAHAVEKQKWDCKEDLEHFSSKWTPEKQKFCCDLGMGCLGESGAKLTSTSTPAPEPANRAKPLHLKVGQPFAEKVEPNTASGVTYTAMAAPGGTWPSWLQFDPIEGRLYGTPTTPDSAPVQVQKTALGGNELQHVTFNYQLDTAPAEPQSTTPSLTTAAMVAPVATTVAPPVSPTTPTATTPLAPTTPTATTPGTLPLASPAPVAPASSSPTPLAPVLSSPASSSTAEPTTTMKKFAPSSKDEAIADKLPEFDPSLASLKGNLALPKPGHCWEQDTMCEPMDMNWSLDQLAISTADADECQKKCRHRSDCGCFSYYTDLKICHLASIMSELKTGRAGFQGGKANCDAALQGVRKQTVKQITRKRNCMTNRSFYPLQCSPIDHPATFVDDPVVCQHRCQQFDWCKSFVYNTLTKSCDLQCSNSSSIDGPAYSMSGPKTCDMDIVLPVTLSCPSNFDGQASEWAQVLVSGLSMVVDKIGVMGGKKKAGRVRPEDIQASMAKESENSWSYKLRFEVEESLAMYLYYVLKTDNTGDKFGQYVQNYTTNVALQTLKSQCAPKVTLGAVHRDVEGDSFKTPTWMQPVQQYSVRHATTPVGVKFGWLLLAAASFSGALALWTLPRWRVHFAKCSRGSCEPCPEPEARPVTLTTPDEALAAGESENELEQELLRLENTIFNQV